MYKVLIADDEKNIRQGLMSILDWDELGFVIAGEAANGEDALEKIVSINPDLVLMDIHMPKCYGIETIQKAREQGFPGKFIILSGYSDFTYAQAAIRLGVEFYVTKPIDEDELEEVVKKVKTSLDAEQHAEEHSVFYRKKAKNTILHDIISGDMAVNYVEFGKEELKKLGLLADIYQVIIYEKFGMSPQDPSYDIVEMLKTVKNDEYIFDAFEEDGNNVILLKGQIALRKIESFLEKFDQDIVMEGSPLDSIFIAYGRPVKSIDEVYLSYEEALALAKRRFFCEQGQHVLGYESLSELEKSEEASINNSTIEDYCNKIVGCMQTSNRGMLAETMRSLEIRIYNSNLERNQVVTNILDMYIRIQEKAVRVWPDVDLPFDNKDLIVNIRNANYFYEIVMLITDQIKNVMEKMGATGNDSILNDILYYIDHNYQNNITLEAIAPLFGYSSAYIGKMISKAVNENFNSYLDRKRIEKSKELLKDKSIKVYEVASRVGYGNVDYFHKKFKKYEGISPAQYRKQI